jgi:spore coat polysaccharide biosynthesis predicted glycosyltransferase SpsG
LKKKHNILICPLEWGLGHAARMIPIAGRLADMNQNVFIASGKDHLKLFREEMPGLTYIDFPGFSPGYSRYLPQYIPLLFKTPLLLFHIACEHYRLKRIITHYSIDVVISDNRFGLWNRKIRTAYITHMPLIPFPKPFQFLEFIGICLHRIIIRKYSLCLIPDLPGEINLTGRLSHGLRLPENVRFIGILSRFQDKKQSLTGNPFPIKHNTVILSGPEPQRSIFRQRVIQLLRDEKTFTLILEGNPGKGNEINWSDNLAFCNHLASAEMQQVISSSEKIITRAGYSTIMELVSMNRSALLVPTPGQTEQEYLGEYLSSKGFFSLCSQKKLKVGLSLNPGREAWPEELNEQSSTLLDKALSELLE